MSSVGNKQNYIGRANTKDFCIHNRQKIQSKLREKNRAKSSINTQHYEINKQLKSKTEPTEQRDFQFNWKNQCKLNDDFNRTSTKLKNISFSHHNPNLCVCAECTCGRHLCQFHSIRPGFTKNTIYKKDFLKKKPIPNKININGQYDQLKGPILDLDTIYIKQYKQKSSQIERPKPQDLLKSGGPCLTLTSYTSDFPGHKGDNQYVKPTDNYTRGQFAFRSKTTYSNTFVGFPGKRAQWCKTPDNLKTGSNWYGSTTYSNNFKQPNPQDYAKQYKIHQKLETNPDFNHQFETMYKKQFTGHDSSICPAKVVLQTRSKGFYSKSKNRFAQNTDFKSLDPNFHPISTFKMA